MSTLRISDAPLLPNVSGGEKIPTGGRGDYAVSVDQIKDYVRGGLPQQIEDHVNDTSNPHQVTKAQVGLGSVNNTSDLNKPISTATLTALSLKADKTYVDSQDLLKADKSYVDSRDSLKADKTYVDSQDSLKADKTAVHSKSATLPTYYTKEDGVNSVTGVADGAYFNVRSTDDESYVDEYQNVGGVATPTGKSCPSSSAKWDASLVVDGDKNQKQINAEQQELNNLLLLSTVSTYVITPETHTDISDVLNTIPANSTVILKNGSYIASGVNIEKDNYKIEMQEGVVLILKAGSNGVFMRFGKRGPASDYNADNLPQHNGTLDYWDEVHYSQATPEYPRYKNLGVSGGTIILDSSNGTGAGTGVDFYRCDNPLLETNVKWSSKFSFGNGVRIHFCKNMISSYLNIDDNENSTFTILYYWSYGLRAGAWDIGMGQDTSMEFKHSVDGYVSTLKCRGSGGVCKALNYGYGSINNTIDRLEARNGSVRLKASEEFDLTRGVVINDLDIENVGSDGLVISHVAGLRVGKFNIRAKRPIYFSAAPFYKFSSNQPVTPIQSTAEYTFDGNYRTSEVSGGITKYFEKRAYPVLQNSSFGQGELIATAGAANVIAANIPGGVADIMASNGKLRRFEEGQIPVNGYREDWRTSFNYEYTAPSAISNIDFGDMTLKAENNAVAITTIALFTMPLINCSGTLRTYADKKSLQFIWMFDSDITLQTNRFLTAAAGFVVEMDSMVRSKLRGKWLANGRTFNFKGGSTSFYTDGYVGHELLGEIIRQSTPTSGPPLYTNFSTPTDTWKPITLTGLKIYAEDGSSVSLDENIIRHFGSLPVGVSAANGSGYVCDQACMTDHNQPFRRGFTDASAETLPPLTPNFIGELAVNTTTNTWWKANSATTWSKL